jgi:hypothetical protein
LLLDGQGNWREEHFMQRNYLEQKRQKYIWSSLETINLLVRLEHQILMCEIY